MTGPAAVLGDLREGDSIAVNGVCLTAIAPTASRFDADLAAETLRVTTLGELKPGAVVNLELPTRAGAPLGGHIVLGHVEATGRLLSMEAVETGTARPDWKLRVWAPPHLRAGLVEKGSVAVDGISLTIAALKDAEREGLRTGSVIEIAIIPHTYEATRLQTLAPGDPVNLETDVMLRRDSDAPPKPRFELTAEYLVAHGY